MSLLGNVFGFVGDSLGEIGSHPLQAAGTAFGVPGYDPVFGGLFNNQNGGALISPTGNFTSSAWQNMYNADPSTTGALNTFNSINGAADKVVPAIAGGYAAPGLMAAFGGAGGASAGTAADAGVGIDAGASVAPPIGMGAGVGSAGDVGTGATGLLGSGNSDLSGLIASDASGDAGLNAASLTGLMGDPASASADPLAANSTGIFGSGMTDAAPSGPPLGALGPGPGAGPTGTPASTSGSLLSQAGQTINQGQKFLQMSQQQPAPLSTPIQTRVGNPQGQRSQMPIGPSMPYTSFSQAQQMGMPMNNTFGFGGAYG